MSENRVLAVVLVALLVGAYLSWHHEADAPGTASVRLVDARPEALERLDLIGPTSTVAVSFEEIGGQRRAWIELTNRGRARAFIGNEAFDRAIERYVRLEALRSLGRLDAEEMDFTELGSPQRKLRIELKGSDRAERFEIGARTSGARDFYLRRAGDDEVFLLAGATITDLEAPQGRYMQRKLREQPISEVETVELMAGDRRLTMIHKNRLSPSDAYWARQAAPDEVDDALGNYVQKVERLSASTYLEAPERFARAAPVLTVRWLGVGGEPLDELELRREDEGSSATFFARSKAVGRPVEVARFAAEQLVEDLNVVFQAP